MMKYFLTVLTAVFLAGAVSADAPDKAIVDAISKRLHKPQMGLKVSSVKHSSIPSLYEVGFANGLVVFATATGGHFIAGDMFAVQGDELSNLSELRREAERRQVLAGIPQQEMIVYPAKGVKKASITVFTDVTCGYCRKLHREVPALNANGVEVRYLAWPRGGMRSEGYRLLTTAWCADDAPATLTKLKNREQVTPEVCEGNPVQRQFEIGRGMGVNATPTIILGNGKMIPGYLSAEQLLKELGIS
ncbi:MAG: protein-disulfide isomerase [Gammaproteobacteria bacterium]|nr:MAG: protein-disulfide isomerase [Gammaproteobacteria bacterium]